MRHRDELCAILEEALAGNDTEHWQARLTEAGVPAAPVADVADVKEQVDGAYVARLGRK